MTEHAITQPLQADAEEMRKKRSPYWDNVKAICVLLVLCSHTLLFGSFRLVKGGDHHPDPNKPPEQDLSNQTQVFVDQLGAPIFAALSGSVITLSVVVMPGFSFVSGHLTSRVFTRKHGLKLFQMAVVCGIFQLFSVLTFLPMSHNEPLPLKIYGAPGIQWFLICLTLWRVTLPFWMMLRYPMAVSIIVGTLAIVSDAKNMYCLEFLTFLPFFMAGHLISRERLEGFLDKYGGAMSRALFILFAALCGAVPAVLAISYPDVSKYVYLTGTEAYACFMSTATRCHEWYSMPLHLLYYLIAVPMIPAFLATIPKKEVKGLTWAGINSMYIYLLHIWLVAPWVAYGPKFEGVAYVAVSLLYAFALWAMLGTGCARMCFRRCIEPDVSCLVRPDFLEEGTTADAPPADATACQPAASGS